MKKKITIDVEGDTDGDIQDAVREAMRRVHAGFTSGHDRSTAHRFSFEVETPVRQEMPAPHRFIASVTRTSRTTREFPVEIDGVYHDDAAVEMAERKAANWDWTGLPHVAEYEVDIQPGVVS